MTHSFWKTAFQSGFIRRPEVLAWILMLATVFMAPSLGAQMGEKKFDGDKYGQAKDVVKNWGDPPKYAR